MVIKMFLKDEILKYRTKANSIVFWCPGIEENNEVTILLNDFLLDISKERKVFFHGYRLPHKDDREIIDPAVILAKAEILLDPFNTFFHLSDARIKINHFDCACEATIYYFDNKVEWSDFLATSVIHKPIKLIEKGILSAHFTSNDHGADFWFECNKTYEKKVLQLFENMRNLGYEIKRSFHLSFPDNNR